MRTPRKTYWPLVSVSFLLSGAAGLIYEVVWARQLTLFVGITTYAHTAVITAFMLGLAAGSLVIGRLCDRHASPLRLYAWLEFAVGLYAASTPWLCGWLQQLYTDFAQTAGVTGTASQLLRFALALLLLLPPTFLMGGALPVMVRGMTTRLPELAATAGRLYGLNTLGAVFGALTAGYVLLPAAGMRASIFVGAALDFAIAGVMLWASRCPDAVVTAAAQAAPDRAPEETALGAPGPRRLILLFFAASGLAALAYQLAWIRALTLVLGASVYSFTTTLAVFLAGLAAGSLVYRRLPGRSNRLAQAATIQAMTGFSAVLGLLVIGRLPEAFLWGYRQDWSSTFALFQLFAFSLCFVVMIVPTFLLGTFFPLMAALWTRRGTSVGRDVGSVYAANTAGTIVGALLAGLVLLPAVGVQGVIIFAAGLHVLVGIGFSWMSSSSRAPVPRLAVAGGLAAAFVLAAVAMPPWNRAIMTSGVYNYVAQLPNRQAAQGLRERAASYKMLYYADGLEDTVSVLQSDQQRLLAINGKIDATTEHDLPTQVMLGQLPMLAHPHPRSVLVIGLGSGITAGVIAADPDVERVDIVEISPEVVKASSFFADANRHVLDDPRVHLAVADARNYLLATHRTYDVIVAQPSNPWISGVANLFTRDFFELLRQRLAPGGIVSQWFHIYNMSPEDTKSVLRSYQDVFPQVSTWLSMDIDLIMLGSRQPHALNGERVSAALAQPDVLASLQQVNKVGLVQIAKMFLFDGDSLSAFCADAPANTDDRPRVEFHAPQNIYRRTTQITLRSFVEHLATYPSQPPVTHLAQADGGRIDATPIGLMIDTARELKRSQWHAECAVWRRYVKTAKDVPDALGVGSQARLYWSEGISSNQLEAFHVDAAPSLDQLALYLQAAQPAPLVVGGQVDLPGGARGAWGLASHADADRVTIAITWTAPSPTGGLLQYLAEREQPDPGRDAWGPALIDFAKCFQPSISSPDSAFVSRAETHSTQTPRASTDRPDGLAMVDVGDLLSHGEAF